MTHFPEHLTTVEANIINHAITAGLRGGGMISVYDGEEFSIRKGRSRQFIQEEVAATDETSFVFFDNAGQRIGVAWFIHGNGADVLSDYSANAATETLLKGTLTFAENQH